MPDDDSSGHVKLRTCPPRRPSKIEKKKKAAHRLLSNNEADGEKDSGQKPAARNASPLTGMKKWLAEYYAKRPGTSVLKQQVDAFMAEYDAREEKAMKEKVAAAEEDGWTVVVGNKGRKKTTDLQSGVRVGAVSTVAVTDRAKKRSKKEVGLDFYRFQKREAKRNEVLELQRKFQDDKARIAKLREARKFRPY